MPNAVIGRIYIWKPCRISFVVACSFRKLGRENIEQPTGHWYSCDPFHDDLRRHDAT